MRRCFCTAMALRNQMPLNCGALMERDVRSIHFIATLAVRPTAPAGAAGGGADGDGGQRAPLRAQERNVYAVNVLRRVRAKLRVAAMMKKMSLPEASAPTVVTPSTPSAAPSAAKGVFARAVTVDEQSD